MSKRGGFPGGMGGFGGMNLGNLMKEAKKMQAEMTKSQEELAQKEFDASAGGGAVTVKVSGEKMLKEIIICIIIITTIFVGRCVIRIADSVLLTCCPPAPPER